MKESVLTWDTRLAPERATASSRNEESAAAIVVSGAAGEAETANEGPNEERCSTTCRRNRPGVKCPRKLAER